MTKNKLFVFINILGLGLTIALCIIAYLNWKFSHDWDATQTNAESIYRIQFIHEATGKHERWGLTPMPLAAHLKGKTGDISRVVRFLPADISFRVGDEVFQTSIAFVDSQFFELFTFEILDGDVRDFNKKGNVFISDELARSYFNQVAVAGKSVTQVIDGTTQEFTIGGVFRKQPLNSSFAANAFVLWDNIKDRGVDEDNWADWNTTFVEIKNPAAVPVVTKELQQYLEPQNLASEDFKVKEYYLENFKGIGRKSVDEPRLRGNQLRGAMPKAVVDIPSIMAVLLLLLACFNFTNTSIALCGQRLKEIGIRKVIGGVRKQLIFQFLGESLLLCFLGLLTGLIIAEFLVPAYDNLWTWLELDLSYRDNFPFLLFLGGLLLLTALLAGGYSAFYITSFEPITILKGKARFGGTSWLTRFLLAAQFSISILTIIFAIGFYHNANYQRDYDLGYYNTGVISSYVKDEAGFNTFRDAIAGNPNITHIAGTKNHLLWAFGWTSVKYESEERQVDVMEVGDNYLEAMNIRVLLGRPFIKDSETDRKESVLVTEEFVKQFKWTDDPIGKRIVWNDTAQWYVVGVVKDIYSRALFRPVEPMLIRYTAPKNYTILVAHAAPGKMTEVNEFMKGKWKMVFPNDLYNGQLIDYKMQETIETNNNVITIFGFIGFFAVLMSATGLYTLVSLQILKRTKEIGVRKVMGASFSNIIRVITLEFLIVILCGCMVGGVIGYAMVDVAMDAAWEYYERVSLLTFGTAALVMITLSVLTTGFKTVTTARMNPVKTLRDE